MSEASLFFDHESVEITGYLLRSPLSVIIGTLDILKEGIWEDLTPVEKRQLINNAYLKAQKMNKLINDCLEKMKVQKIETDTAPPQTFCVSSFDISSDQSHTCA